MSFTMDSCFVGDYFISKGAPISLGAPINKGSINKGTPHLPIPNRHVQGQGHHRVPQRGH
jgi:hypothetical protein